MIVRLVVTFLIGSLFTTSCATADYRNENSSNTASVIVFKSGFEGTVKIAPRGKNHKIVGTDEGFAWPDDLPGSGKQNFFNYVVYKDKDYSEYIETKIVDVAGRDGNPTKALYQAIKKDDRDNPELSRNQYNMYPSATDKFEQMYVKYWIKFQPDLDKIMPKPSWRMIMEWYESGRDYRFNLQVIRPKKGGRLRWRIIAKKLKPKRVTDWIETNNRIRVPVGEWFKLEVFWKHSSGPDGRLLVKVNDAKVFDHIGRNKLNSHIWAYNPFKCYGRTDYYHWIDDFEIRTNLP